MSDLLQRLKASRGAIGRVPLGEFVFGLRVLTEADYLAAQMATLQAMETAGIELGIASSETFEAEKASQLLFRALVDVDTGKALAKTVVELRESLSRADKLHLIEAYLDHEKAYAPSERTLSDADLVAVIDEVKKNPETPRLSALSTASLKRLITVLVAQPAT